MYSLFFNNTYGNKSDAGLVEETRDTYWKFVLIGICLVFNLSAAGNVRSMQKRTLQTLSIPSELLIIQSFFFKHKSL